MSADSKPDFHLDKRRKLAISEINEKINSHHYIRQLRGNFGDEIPSLSLALLLDIIVQQSNGYLQLLGPSVKMVDTRPDLEEKLREAWRTQSYEEIFDLGYLHAPSSSSTETAHSRYILLPPVSGSIESTMRTLQESWKAPYEGDYHKLLFRNINNMYGSLPYENICAIVQSSGMGKSRMVDEQAKLVFTLPINIRRNQGQASFPPPDKSLYEYLVWAAPTDEDACETHYTAFLRSLFSYATTELIRLGISGDDLAKKWYDHMDNEKTRDAFYKKVVEMCGQSSFKSGNARAELSNLVKKLDELCPTTDEVKVVIYVDEAHELYGTVDGSRGGVRKLEVMHSVIGEVYGLRLFCLFLSTQLLLNPLGRSSGVISSERAKLPERMSAPITETPFDYLSNLKIKPGVLRMGDLVEVNHLAQFGRPLWWSLRPRVDPNNPKFHADVARLINLARLKLLCSHAINVGYAEVSLTALAAVLDVLLAFDFVPDRVSTADLEAELVKSHMRIAYSVPKHRMYLLSGYSSEPLLAEAAAQQLWTFGTTRGSGLFDTMVGALSISPLLLSSVTDLGQRGEIAMRVLLMRAYMDGVIADRKDSPSDSPIIFSRGCKLTTFIKQLFVQKYADEILEGKPDNLRDETTFSAAFGRSMVRFTHFVKAGDPYAFSTEALFGAFVRGAAIIGYQTQQCADFAIPVLLDEGKTLQESTMSAILIQVKRCTGGRGPSTYTIEEEDVGLFPPGTNKERRYISFVAELGVEPDPSEARGIRVPSVCVLPQPEVQGYPPDEHPRYGIVAYGCSDVYRDVTKGKISELLAAPKFWAEHPHYDPESHKLLMKLKPVWVRAKDMYHWLESDLLASE